MTDCCSEPGYYDERKCCPECGSDHIVQTLTGYMRGPDRNRADCDLCDWKGRVHDLEPPPAPPEAPRVESRVEKTASGLFVVRHETDG